MHKIHRRPPRTGSRSPESQKQPEAPQDYSQSESDVPSRTRSRSVGKRPQRRPTTHAQHDIVQASCRNLRGKPPLRLRSPPKFDASAWRSQLPPIRPCRVLLTRDARKSLHAGIYIRCLPIRFRLSYASNVNVVTEFLHLFAGPIQQICDTGPAPESRVGTTIHQLDVQQLDI
jgi:hypothetical protein